MTSLSLDRTPQKQRTPVMVNGDKIPLATIEQEVQFHTAPSMMDAWQMAARALAVRTLLLQEAQRLGLAPAPENDDCGLRDTDDEALIRQLIDKEVATPEPDEATCQRYYQQNNARFCSPPIFEACHILLAVSPKDTELSATRRAEAELLIEALSQDPAKFSGLARQVSDCSSAAQGGNLGQLSPGQTTPAFDAALQDMSPGELSATPVESPYGFHIIHLHQRIEGRQLPFETVRDRIAEYLKDKVRHTAIAQYIARLASAARITGVTMPDAQDMRVF